jgi:benzodiazapine receptor
MVGRMVADLRKLITSILICQIVGNLGTLFTIQSLSVWYANLQKPDFTPPGWLFGPVWLILYTLMGISMYLVWEKGSRKKEANLSFSLFGIQLFLNFLWSLLFFGLRSPSYGFVCIIALWISIAATIFLFLKTSSGAAALLLPYIAWVSIAAVLNFYIMILN